MKIIQSLLIIDDSPADVEIAKYFLRDSKRYQTIWNVSDGTEALGLFSEYEVSKERLSDRFPPDLILLDINMPKMTGFEFLEAYQQLDRRQPDPTIVMLTSSEYGDDVERAEAHPLVQRYLVKPIEGKEATMLAEMYGTNVSES